MIFASLYLAPGSPLAALSGGRALPPASVHVLEQRYHLNAPFLAQYWYWLDNALHGNLGISITLRENVSTLIASRIWTTAGLVLYATVIIMLIGIGLGILAGLRPGLLDTSSLAFTALTAAIPSFVDPDRQAAGGQVHRFPQARRALPGPGGGQQHAEHLLPVDLAVGGRVAAGKASPEHCRAARRPRSPSRAEGQGHHPALAVPTCRQHDRRLRVGQRVGL